MSYHAGHPRHLAWHETLELHELVAFQTAQLVSFKKKLPTLHDPSLIALYTEAARGLDLNLRELLQFYPLAPDTRSDERPAKQAEIPPAEAGQLLGFAKTAVRNYALAITETATPQLRATFQNHLLKAIALHAKVFSFMYERGYYPAYDLKMLLASDVNNVRAALSL